MTTPDPVTLTVSHTTDPGLIARGQTTEIRQARGQFTTVQHYTRQEAHALLAALSIHLIPED